MCGNTFSVPRSRKRVTCSPECRHKHLVRVKTGKTYKWHSEKAMQTILRKKKEGVPLYVQRAGMKAAKNHPLYGPFDRNVHAIEWTLRSPDGEIHTFRNLNLWAREHADLFGEDPQKWKRLASGFRQVKRSMQGKTKRPANSYKGWTIIAWSNKDKH